MDTTTTKTVTINHNGFHGHTTVKFRPIREAIDYLSGDPEWVVSYRTAKRLNAAVCGVSDCKCGEWIASVNEFDHEAACYVPQVTEVRGNYPQD